MTGSGLVESLAVARHRIDCARLSLSYGDGDRTWSTLCALREGLAAIDRASVEAATAAPLASFAVPAIDAERELRR